MDAQFDLSLESEEDEPSPLEYAREQGLCIDYTTEPVTFMNVDTQWDSALDESPCESLSSSIADAISALTRERLAVSRETALLLKAVYNLRELSPVDHSESDRRIWILGRQQELPVLQSDHDLDLLSFGSVASPNFENIGLAIETVDKENDEGFEWPVKYLTYPTQCDGKLKAEKLTVSKNALLYLQEAVHNVYVSEDGEALKAENLMKKTDLLIRPITPPLLPLSPLPVPYIPSSPANNLPLASDSGDSVCVEALDLQNEIMAADSLMRKESDSSDSMLPDVIQPPSFSPLSAACAVVSPKRRVEDLRVEGPLTPPIFSTSPMKKLKSVCFATTADEYISYKPWGQDKASDDDVTSDELELLTGIKPLAEKVRNLVKDERLSGADTTARVDVPNLDFTLPVVPWFEYSQRTRGRQNPNETELEAQTQFLRRIKRENLKSVASWHEMSIPEREMQWSFWTTKISALKLKETLHGESEMKKFVDEVKPGVIATSSAQVWKREGLRILDEDEEDEIEPELNEDSEDMEALVRKRKLEIEEETAEKQNKRKGAHHPSGESLPKKTLDVHCQMSYERSLPSECMQAAKKHGNEVMFSGFSAPSALHRFLQTRGKAVGFTKPEIVEKSAWSNRTWPVGPPDCWDANRPVEHPQHKFREGSCRGEDETIPTRPLPSFPDVPIDLKPYSFIISSKFLQHRNLFRQIEQLFPSADMVYRDYTLPHSPANEADIIVSPSTGLITFSLQQAKQRALPGQPEKSLIKERMVSLQSRCERLIVMISEHLSRDMEELGSSRPEDPRDKEALKAIEAFAAQLEGEVIVRYIPGGEKALARSMVIEMGKYGLPHGSADLGDIKPLAQETTHEVFLRRAGLNPFAAQAIVALLKKPVVLEVPPCPISPFLIEPKTVAAKGLCRFLIMSAGERIHSFQVLMGGSRVLQGVNRRLDQEWISAAHGFRI